mmetsp:Transcript_15341/g.26650  ORF Transcript_15341/g.26650 Transcript_15341/m.26650 type:complete len:306 (+) Transcript_15341:200-1117(+)
MSSSRLHHLSSMLLFLLVILFNTHIACALSSIMNVTEETDNLFRVVHYEAGQTEDRLPIFTTTPQGALQLLDEVCTIGSPEVQQYDDDGVFVIHNLLSPAECRRIIEMSERMGYTEDAPVSLGRKIRQNENCVWIMDEGVNQVVFDRIRHLLPEEVEFRGTPMGSGPQGLNRRWRLYKYNPNDIFKRHTDGPWPPSGIDKDGKYVHDTSDGNALTWLTFLIYLNDDFEGGGTKFPSVGKPDYTPEGTPNFFEVQPTQGSVLVFYHGYHSKSKLHEGSLVTKGTKYVARTEVLYRLPPELSDLRGG